MEAYESSGDGGTAPLILSVTTMCMWVVIFTLRPLYLREKNTRFLLIGSLAGPQSWSERFGKGNMISLSSSR